ncbi:MAG: hypothetical protein HYS32_04325 [Candidatus Woesearchaeota archaeon]|nr:MAG: hypothetical protein HYS32_04325 [Candidatus Woesearchaeota archaeon]
MTRRSRRHWIPEEDVLLKSLIDAGRVFSGIYRSFNEGKPRELRRNKPSIRKRILGIKAGIIKVNPSEVTESFDDSTFKVHDGEYKGSWKDEEAEVIEEGVRRKYSGTTLVSFYRKHFPGSNRTDGAIEQRATPFRRLEKRDVGQVVLEAGTELKVKPRGEEPGRGVGHEILLRSHQVLDAPLQRLQDDVYRMLSGIANSMRLRGLYERFMGLSFEDLLGLGEFERKRVASILEKGEKITPLREVPVLVVPGFGIHYDRLSVIFPVFLQDARGGSNRELWSCVHDISLAVLLLSKEMGGMGLQRIRDVGRESAGFRDMMKYNFIRGPLDCGEASTKVTSYVSEAFEGVGVTFEQQIPGLFVPLEQEEVIS